jgi:polar amino acid transport system substrate-binding protein
MEAKFKPYEFVDEAGQIVGIDVDLAKKMFEEDHAITVKITDVDFQGLIASLVQGKADMIISGIGATRERAQSVDFSIPYSPSGSVIVVHRENTTIKGPEDLSGKVVGSQTGSTPMRNAEFNDAELKSKGKPGHGETRGYASFPAVYEDLRVKRIDAVVAGYSTSSLLVKERPEEFKIVSEVGPPSYFHVAVPKGETAFADFISANIRKWRRDGTLVAVHQKWYGDARIDINAEIAGLPDQVHFGEPPPTPTPKPS